MKFNATAIQHHQAGSLLNLHYRNTRENILGDGLKLCQRAKAHNSSNPNTAYIAVKPRDGGYTAKMHDVAQCGNAHLCPFCSGLKASNMRDWITLAFLPQVKSSGLVTGLLTLTAHHRRESDWGEFVKNFYRALEAFGKTMRRNFKAVGSLGRVRAMECPVGSNGLHIHLHDLFTYKPGTDIDALCVTALAKWKAALRQFGLHCSKNGVDIKKDGDFDPRYIAKEMAAHNTKTDSKSDLVTLFELLDRSARGNKQAGDDWIRAAKAIQGRDRWNVGQLAKKLNIECPSSWRKPEGDAKSEPLHVIEYPQTQHIMATEPNSERPGLAIILRTARQNLNNTVATQKIVTALCLDYTKQRLLKASIVAAEDYARCTTNIAALLASGAIKPEMAPDLDARAVVEIQLQQKERIAAIKTKLHVATTPQLHLQPGAELVFV